MLSIVYKLLLVLTFWNHLRQAIRLTMLLMGVLLYVLPHCLELFTPSDCFFFFYLFRQLAHDEGLIIFLQTSLFLVFPYAVDNCIPLSSRSSLTLSIHLNVREDLEESGIQLSTAYGRFAL